MSYKASVNTFRMHSYSYTSYSSSYRSTSASTSTSSGLVRVNMSAVEEDDPTDLEVQLVTRTRAQRPDRRKRGWTVVTGREIR
ncbi:hypothetical protein J6590_012805 [Homalodisca vitripennis]|nr:hypothetical protein J6590_012805 [Homalodisca vitripennis]